MTDTLCAICGTTAKQPGRDGVILHQFKVGEAVRVPISGATGVIIERAHPHVGWLVRWDVPKFGVTQGWVRSANLDHGDHADDGDRKATDEWISQQRP